MNSSSYTINLILPSEQLAVQMYKFTRK